MGHLTVKKIKDLYHFMDVSTRLRHIYELFFIKRYTSIKGMCIFLEFTDPLTILMRSR